MAPADSVGPALVIIDVQAGFISEYTERCLPRIHELARSGRFETVIATRFSNPEGSPFRRLIGWSRLATDEEVALDPVVEKHADLIIDKVTYGAGAELESALRARGIVEATIVGIDTDVCVLHNAAALFDRGFTVHVDLGGCATNGGPDADAAAVPLLRRTIGGNQVIPRADTAS